MRKAATAVMFAAMVTAIVAAAARADEKPSAAAENQQLKDEVRLLRTQLDVVTKRLDALEGELKAPPAPTAHAAAPPPFITPAGSPLGAAQPPAASPAAAPGQTIGGAVKKLMPGEVTSPTTLPPMYSNLEGGQGGGVIIPSVPGVPKVFIPDIGAVGDFLFQQDNLRAGDPRYNPANDKFIPRDTQIILFSPIDPYTNAQISIDKPNDGPFDIEEAFLVFNKLPYDVTLRAGQFRQQFGLINGLDTFQLPMVNRPQALASYIGQDGFVEPGVELNGYVPNPWEADIKADFNMLSGVNTVTYNHRGGRNFDFLYMGTLSYARDMFRTGSLTTGISFAGGPGRSGEAYLMDPFAELRYAPDQRHIWTWSVESLLAERKGVGDHGLKRGLYSLLDYNFRLRYHAGVLVDMADVPNAASGTEVGISPILTYFVSDNTRLRLQYTHTTASGAERAEDALFVQATFALGNLKPLE
jgi:hypothetical protein